MIKILSIKLIKRKNEIYCTLKSDSIKIMLLGSGELGKEVIIESSKIRN